MMRDRIERVCSSNWDITAALTPKDQNMKLAIARNAIDTSDQEFFKEEPPVTRLAAGIGVQDQNPDQLRAPAGLRIEHAAHRYQRAGLHPAQYFA